MDHPIPGALPYIRHAAAHQVMPDETVAAAGMARQKQSGANGRYVTAALLALLVTGIFLYTIFTRL